MAKPFDPKQLSSQHFAQMRAASRAQSSGEQGNGDAVPVSYDNRDTNNPHRLAVPVDPAAAAAQQLNHFSTLAQDIADPDAQATARTLLGALQNMAAIGRGFDQIRGWARSGGRNTALAQSALDAQRSLVENAASAATAADKALRPQVLALVYPQPLDIKPEDIERKKSDIVEALKVSGKSAANRVAQQMIDVAIQANDQPALYCLVGVAPLRYLADSLGVRQDVLASVYASRMLAKYGARPLAGIGQVPNGVLISELPQLDAFTRSEISRARQTIDDLAAECGLN